MKVLIIGGTGLISQGIVKHLLERQADVTMFNRGQRANPLPGSIKVITGDRNEFAAFERQFASSRYDVVIDMICFNPDQAQSDIRAFGGRCEHFIFCSTVCSYGVKVPPRVLVDETFAQEPTSDYGRGKVACEQALLGAGAQGKFKVTVIRPSHTYGPGHPLIDNLENDPVAWDRIERGQPVLCSGDGLGLWVATHRDDCGKLFAYAALNPKTYQQSYNATCDANMTWRDYYGTVAQALGKPVQLIFMPSSWITPRGEGRFGLLYGITGFHGAYDSSKAKRDVPQFRCEIDLARGAAEVFADQKRRGVWRSSANDPVYEKMIAEALALGIKPVAVR